MNKNFFRFSHRFQALGFSLLLILIMAWAWVQMAHPTPVYAIEVPFGAEYLVDGAFDGAYSIASADLDGDGDPDLVSAAKNAGDLVWWANEAGDGTVWSTPNVIADAFLGAVEALPADLDRDGDLDLLGISDTTGDLMWWENTAGNGSVWTPTLITSFFDTATSVFVADLNQDGAPDIAVVGTVTTSESVFWYENVGGGTSWISHPVATGLNTPSDVLATDLDQDGTMDLVVSSLSSAEISWWRNDNGTGLTWTPFVVSSNYAGASGLEVADLDGDGDPDLIGAFASDDTISWRENDGTGQGWADHPIVTTLADPVAVAATDLDRDGDLDVLGAGNTADQVLWWDNSAGDGSTWTAYPISTQFDGARALHPADINQDGLMDVIGAAEVADDVLWWQSTAIHRNAEYPVTRAVLVDGNMDGAFSMAAGDLNQDGMPDFLGGSFSTGEVAWYQNGTHGQTWTKFTIGNLFGVRALAVADLNGDARLDVLAAGQNANAIVWWANNGAGVFGSVQTIEANFAEAVWVTTGDLDGDGDQDVLGAGFSEETISWWENVDGLGTFGARHDLVTGYAGAISAAIADLDQDGDLDVVGAANTNQDVSWWENNGDGMTWTLHPLDLTINGPGALFSADVDGDGDFDVLGMSKLDHLLVWWENLDGNGTFNATPSVIADAFVGAASLFGADLDQDGDVDVTGAAQYGNTLSWFENEGGTGASWTEHILSDSLLEPVVVSVADIDVDGRPDILSAAAVDGDLHWWGNGGGQFSLSTQDTSPQAIAEGETTDVLAITASHLGKPGEAPLELETFELLFEEEPGNGMGPPESNAIIENLYIYLDDGSGIFEQTNDTVVTTVATLTLISGRETITLPAGETSILLNPGETKVYFVVLEIMPEAGSGDPNQLLLTHLTDDPVYKSAARDIEHDVPLQMAYAPNVAAFLATFSPDLFLDKYANTIPIEPGPMAPAGPSGGPGIVEPGELITYTIFYSNTGTTTATGVIIADMMPPEALYTGFTSTGLTVTLTIEGDTYLWDIGTLPPQTNGSITILSTLATFMSNEYTFQNTAILTGTIAASTFNASSSAGLEINIPPTVNAGPDHTIIVDQLTTYTASFTDPGNDDTHQAIIDWGDGHITDGIVNQQTNTVTGSHLYPVEGIYLVQVFVIDSDGGVGLDEVQFVVKKANIYLPIAVRP